MVGMGRNLCEGRTPGSWSKCDEEQAGVTELWSWSLSRNSKGPSSTYFASHRLLPSLWWTVMELVLYFPRVLATPSPELLALERAADPSGPTNMSIHSLFQNHMMVGPSQATVLRCVQI